MSVTLTNAEKQARYRERHLGVDGGSKPEPTRRRPVARGSERDCADELCRRFMRIPGISPISALAYKTLIASVPPFKDGRCVSRADAAALAVRHVDRYSGAHLEVTASAASALRGRQPHADALPGLLQSQGVGLKIAKKAGHKRACVAVARKLAVIMLADVARRQRVPVQGTEGAGQRQHDLHAKAYRRCGVTYK
jgi:hypothetical protein